jgi:hypothetical protein
MPDPIRWGLDNPHPLSQMKTELVWVGKYDARKDKSLALRTDHPYDAPGEYRVMVKVIDILGNDTTKTLTVEVRP